MLLLPNPKRLLVGYLLGALLTSFTLGLVIVFSLEDSGVTETTKNTVGPATDFVLGAIALVLAFVLSRDREKDPGDEGRPARRRRLRKESKEDKGPPLWQRKLSEG